LVLSWHCSRVCYLGILLWPLNITNPAVIGIDSIIICRNIIVRRNNLHLVQIWAPWIRICQLKEFGLDIGWGRHTKILSRLLANLITICSSEWYLVGDLINLILVPQVVSVYELSYLRLPPQYFFLPFEEMEREYEFQLLNRLRFNIILNILLAYDVIMINRFWKYICQNRSWYCGSQTIELLNLAVNFSCQLILGLALQWLEYLNNMLTLFYFLQ